MWRPVRGRWALALVLVLIPLLPATAQNGSQILVVDKGGDRVLAYDASSGAFLGVSAEEATSGFDTPTGIARLGPWVYVSATTNQAIVRYALGNATDHEVLLQFPDPNFPGLVNPRDLEVGPDGCIYVAVEGDRSSGTGVILRYDPDLDAFEVFADFHGTNPATSRDGLLSPMDLAFGPDGHLYVANRQTLTQPVKPGNNILRFTGPLDANPGVPLPAPGKTGAVYHQIANNELPNALTFGPDRDGDGASDIYLARLLGNDRLLVVSGPLGATPGASPGTFLAAPVNTPWGLGFLDSNLYVASYADFEVRVYDGNGVFQHLLAPTGDEPPDAATGRLLDEPIELEFLAPAQAVPSLTRLGLAALATLISVSATGLLRRREHAR